MICTIALHECRKYYNSGRFWKLLALTQCTLSLIYYWSMTQFFDKSQKLVLEYNADLGNITEEVLHPLFGWTTLFFFFITPLLATQVITQERKSHTLDLYFLSAIPTSRLIMGKFFGTFMIQLFLCLPILLLISFTAWHYTIDWGQCCAGLLGLVLLLAASLSIGIFVSSFTKEPIISAFSIFISLVLLSLLEWIASTSPFYFLSEFSLLYHCKNLLSGLINSQDFVYYTGTTLVFLLLSMYRLNRESLLRRAL